jgi:hypothetical protein
MRISILRLAFVTTFSSASHVLTLPHNPGSQTPCDAGSRGLDLAISATLRARGGYVVPRTSRPVVSHSARLGRIPRVMSLRVHDSNKGDFVSHPNDKVKRPVATHFGIFATASLQSARKMPGGAGAGCFSARIFVRTN